MKNLPDKIYLNLNMTPQEVVETKNKDFHEATKTWEITWSEESLSEHDPEYTRTDAFIEKACEFMRNNIDKQLTIYHEQTWCKRDEFIERFKNYMRGE